MTERLWKCPKCGHMITNTELQSAMLNYDCNGCKKSDNPKKMMHRIGDYVLVKQEISNDITE